MLDAAHPADGVTAWEYDCVIYNGVSDEARTLDSMILDWSALREHINLELGPRGWEIVSGNQTGAYSLKFVFKTRRASAAPATQRELPREFPSS